jgi:hypothetical protein
MRKSVRDVLAGLIFIAFGLTFAGISITYELGTAFQMGPGYFPFVLGLLLVLFGLAIAVDGFLKTETQEIGAIPWRGLLLLSAAVIVFGLGVKRLGLAPSLFVSAFLAALSSARTSLFAALIMAIGLTTLCIVIFVLGLGMPVPLLGPWLKF